MRGWAHIGTIGPDYVIWLTDPKAPPPGDSVLAYAFAGQFRCGMTRARDVIDRWIPRDTVPALASGDDVYMATVIGESAFDRVEAPNA